MTRKTKKFYFTCFNIYTYLCTYGFDLGRKLKKKKCAITDLTKTGIFSNYLNFHNFIVTPASCVTEINPTKLSAVFLPFQ